MIILITCVDEKGRTVVSHGVDSVTCRNIILPCESLDYFKRYCDAKFSTSYGEWVLDDNFGN